MTSFVIAWYAQDLLRVFSSGHFLVPEIFLLVLLYMALKHEDEGAYILWSGFLGGILWDLRWPGLVGVSSALYVASILFVRWIWLSLPSSARSVPAFGLLIWSAHLVLTFIRLLMWGIREQTLLKVFLVQQGVLLPMVFGACLLYAWSVGQDDA
ncbi:MULTISPECIES: rod shape-determining protein MreD [Aminobacterium]|jgi:cell shape-determining protein MreD|uniref:Uncharacterized protein n=1 Tax=Aminobacterium colombiense (strain DSM 12261 / ALA-1) TaxID=572547 RepID=D5EDV6_AMICL|nr:MULTISPECIES: rod shape-determining protein MreD [Aminobacterium]MDD2379031.1 rod shape-determining protein MreD [Aminobacterium colombiense]ADE56738.1 hypothetical protein Amico_0603 [Aminobacterium colombiense DSM 12261]MDD3767292.1 rod shape-determining protein MreD [Aminobacterium colombiense]MDD4265321.1 rod shape-determining protein MreD [Aminobacterium colombiense]MDD4586031.1 rod shape-determining protein MreD [Aminobacterium colombiense]